LQIGPPIVVDIVHRSRERGAQRLSRPGADGIDSDDCLPFALTRQRD